MPEQHTELKPRRIPFLYPVTFLLAALLIYFFIARGLRSTLLYLAHANWARKFVTSFPPAWYVARRFVAGDTIDDVIGSARQLNDAGLTATIAFLGESVTEAEEANAASDEIVRLVEQIAQSKVDSTVSIKLSQLGLKINEDLALRHASRIVEKAQAHDIFVRIDMEESVLIEPTFRIFRALRDKCGYMSCGVVIQAYLYRSEEDVRWLIDNGVSVRLCKGAYDEPSDVAFPEKTATNDNFIRLTHMLLGETALENGVYTALATHDENMIEEAIRFATESGVSKEQFEFQMLFGVRRNLQEELARQGYRVRIYVPYGTAWYPYLMRRLAERPANLWFFMVNFFRR
jgi:proline dehydrogenase